MEFYAQWIVQRRYFVIGLTIILSILFGLQIRNLKVVIEPNSNLPQDHPYVVATNQVESSFASKNVVVIGITPKSGDALQHHILEKIDRITTALSNTQGVIGNKTLSLTSHRAKSILGTPDGLEVRPFLEIIPKTAADMQTLRDRLSLNPVYTNLILSKDHRTAAIIIELRDPQEGYHAMMESIQSIIGQVGDESVGIVMGGWPVLASQLEHYSDRILYFFPLAILLIGLIHYEAFRTLQGLVLPLVTSLLAVVWGLGIMGLAHVRMDAFNVMTPILILAIAAGHSVQILKRYYEEYRPPTLLTHHAVREANNMAVVGSITKMGPVMLASGVTAILAFFSLLVFKLTVLRTFGLFTGLGICSALILEMTFIPAVRSLLPPPTLRDRQREHQRRSWNWITNAIADLVTGRNRRFMYILSAVLLILSATGALRVVVDDSMKNYFLEDLPFRAADRLLNRQLGGTETLYVLIEGHEDGAIQSPEVLRAMQSTQRYFEQQPFVGKTVSLADFVTRIHRAMHGDDPSYDAIPLDRELISQYLLLYSLSGQPDDFDSYVDYAYRTANIWVFLRTDSTAIVREFVTQLTAFLASQFGQSARVTLGGGSATNLALNEVIVKGKILNMLQITAVILIVASLLFRSLIAGFLVLLPLSLAVLANFGLMGAVGIPLNTATAVLSAMAVGIGADYAIYMIYRIQEELRTGQNETEAFRIALNTAGKAILFVASAIAGGYGILIFSWGYKVHIWFGFLTALSMIVSSMGALILLPSLLLTLRPRFLFLKAKPDLFSRIHLPLSVFCWMGLCLFPASVGGAEPSAREIMEKTFIVSKVSDSIAEATFTLTSKSGQERIRRTSATTKLQSNGIDTMQLVRFMYPPDVKGTATLIIEHDDKDDDIWIYLPALKKIRRLAAANKKDSFLGTDFSYGDVIGHKVDEWEHRLIKESTVDGRPCYLVESIPKTEAVRSNTGYSKRANWILKDSFVAVKNEFWDLSGARLKTATFKDIKLVDPVRNRWQPMLLHAVNHQTGHQTIIRFETFKADQGVKDELFTPRYLEREP
jgi:predicted RND superfamily exporter protein